MLAVSGFVDIQFSDPVDPFAGAGGEEMARHFEVFAYTFLARKP